MGAVVADKGGKHEKKSSKDKRLSLPSKKAEVKTAEAAPAWENPLVPNALLREIYQKMVEIRLLGELATRSGGRTWKQAAWGQEACRVSLVQGLGAGDLVMDSQAGGVMDHLLGAKLPEVVRTFGIGKKAASAKKPAKELAVYLKDAEERLFAGMGAALLLKKTEGKAVIFVKNRETSNGVLRRALNLTAKHELPVIIVALAKPGKAWANLKSAGLPIVAEFPALRWIALMRLRCTVWRRSRWRGYGAVAARP